MPAPHESLCMKIAVLHNPAAGINRTLDLAVEISRLFAQHNVPAEILEIVPEQIAGVVQRKIREGVEVVVAAGGDGTVSSVAATLVDTPVALGVLPVGTLNHFAKDLGLPLDLPGAVEAIVQGNRRQIDVGEVNGRTFINNSSIGIYPVVVRHRDKQRQQLGRNKWIAMFLAALRVFKRFPLFSVVIHSEAGTARLKTSFVFVGNNRYEIELFRLGIRPHLDQERVCVYTSTTKTRWGIVRLAWRALWGKLQPSADFYHECLHEFVIESRRPRLSVAVDGEVKKIATPLVYRSRPKALTVVVPAAATPQVVMTAGL
jgi:diacylglycerol kinase family enzyme